MFIKNFNKSFFVIREEDRDDNILVFVYLSIYKKNYNFKLQNDIHVIPLLYNIIYYIILFLKIEWSVLCYYW
jgi:hypothetical protein